MAQSSPVRHLLLDRDGVLNRELDHPVRSPEDWIWEDSVLAALRLVARHRLAVSVVTNQAGIGRGTLSLAALTATHSWLRDQMTGMGVRLVGIFECHHTPDAGCGCRKPRSGLVLDALAAAGFPASESVLIGDDLRDLRAALDAQVPAVLVRTGKGAEVETAAPYEVPVVDDLLGAIELVLDRQRDAVHTDPP